MLACPPLNASHHQIYFYLRWHSSTHSAPYFTYCLVLAFFFIQPRLCQFLHLLSSSRGPNSFSPLLRSPTFLSLRFSTPVSALLAPSRRNTGGVWNIYVCEGNTVTEGEQHAILAIHILCSQMSRWEGTQHSGMTFSPSLWKRGLCVFKVQWICQCGCRGIQMRASVWFPWPYVHIYLPPHLRWQQSRPGP